ncbi:MAG: glycerophosphodiester phosphodiesterase [Allorhizobium sp.]
MNDILGKTGSIWSSVHPAGQMTFIGGHRGSSIGAVENTLAAFKLAIAEGADFIETDLRLTRDGIPVAFHDANLERLHGDPRSVAELDLAELRAIHPQTVTIAEALEVAAGHVSVLLDTKIAEPQALSHSIEFLGPWLRGGTVAFGTRSIAASELIRQELPDCPVLGLYQDYSDYPALAAMGGLWARLWEEDASARAIAELQELGLKVIVMAGRRRADAVGLISPDALATLLEWHPDAVMLNDVKTGVAVRDTALHQSIFT